MYNSMGVDFNSLLEAFEANKVVIDNLIKSDLLPVDLVYKKFEVVQVNCGNKICSTVGSTTDEELALQYALLLKADGIRIEVLPFFVVNLFDNEFTVQPLANKRIIDDKMLSDQKNHVVLKLIQDLSTEKVEQLAVALEATPDQRKKMILETETTE